MINQQKLKCPRTKTQNQFIYYSIEGYVHYRISYTNQPQFRQSATSPGEDILPKLDLRTIDEVHAEDDVGCSDGFPYDQSLYSKKIRTSPIPNSIIRHNSPNGSPNSLEVDRYSQESLNLDDFDQVQTVR